MVITQFTLGRVIVCPSGPEWRPADLLSSGPSLLQIVLKQRVNVKAVLLRQRDLAIGFVQPRARFAVPAGAIVGLLAWALPLAALQIQYGAGSAAESLAAIMGFGHLGAIPIVLTCTVGLLLGLTGAWLGSAARSLAYPAISR